jgi:hypothetical protein
MHASHTSRQKEASFKLLNTLNGVDAPRFKDVVPAIAMCVLVAYCLLPKKQQGMSHPRGWVLTLALPSPYHSLSPEFGKGLPYLNLESYQ